MYFLLCIFSFIFSANLLSQQSPKVHVLLEKIAPEETPSWTFCSDKGFIIRDPYHTDHYDPIGGQKCHVHSIEGALWINKKRLTKNRITIEPQEGALLYNGTRYSGSISLIPENGVWHVVNTVDLEAYVCSVLRSESWPGWPLEVNKAFAIMQRSYVMAKVLEARAKRKKGKPLLYDIGCTNRDQTYQGMHDFPILQQAVDETRGVVMAYQKKPIMAMYDTCCGGLIPAQMKSVNFTGMPYLARTYPCTFCTDCKVYSWKVTYMTPHFEQLCVQAGVPMKNVQELKIAKQDKAGLVQEVKIRAGKRWHTVTGKKMYNICKDIKSYCFSAACDKKSVTFTGRGYGHHLGLCQWGAKRMVDKGWHYKEILNFYYPNVAFMRVEVLTHNQESLIRSS
jgi:stage II sporulation protein D